MDTEHGEDAPGEDGEDQVEVGEATDFQQLVFRASSTRSRMTLKVAASDSASFQSINRQ